MRKIAVFTAFILFLILPGQLLANFSCKTLATDIEVLYLYDEPAFIDWPVIYYLAAEKDCRVNLISLQSGNNDLCRIVNSKDYNIASYQFMARDKSDFDFEQVMTSVNSWRLPDIVVFGRDLHRSVSKEFERYLLVRENGAGNVFGIKKIIRGISKNESGIYINNNFYLKNHYDQLNQLAAEFGSTLDELDREQIYSVYSIVQDNTGGDNQVSILSGIANNRFERLIEKNIANSMVVASMKSVMSEYLDNISGAAKLEGREKINGIFDALESLYRLRQEYYSDMSSDSSSVVAKYISSLLNSVSSKIIELTGIDFEYRSMLRDTPQGPRIKLVEEINNNGPLKIMAGTLTLKPNWNQVSFELPLEQKDVLPFASLVREHTIDADAESLIAFQPDSMLVIGTIRYRGRKIEYRAFAEAYLETPLKISLVPNFAIVQPNSDEKLVRLVEPIKLKAVITKPSFKSTTAKIQVVAPKGIMAGAYQETITMPVGIRALDISIPLVATKGLTAGRKPLIVNLIENKYIIASDTAYIRRAYTYFNEKAKIALLSGPDGLLEDILANTGANYRTISNRYLETRELDQFDIIALGTGCYQYYPVLASVQGKLKKFMERGGTVLVFGQPRDWPPDLLPVSILPNEKLLPGDQLTVIEDTHPIFKRTEPSKFLEYINSRYKSYPALVAPSEPIVLLDDNVAMLTESKFKEGRLIYCGLPLLEMFENLDLVAITFFTGLINYSGK